MQIIEKTEDLSITEKEFFFKKQYVCIDTETTGLDYLHDKLCTIQLFCENYSIIIKFDTFQTYNNLKEILYCHEITKIFHNAVFDVSFLMKNLNMDSFGKIVCTKIASKIVNGLTHNNSLKPLLKEYLNIDINKSEQLSDWSKSSLSDDQINYAINDVKFLYYLWNKLHLELINKNLDELADKCFEFVPYYKEITDLGIENIFAY
ncbi:ribonuclease D [Faecalicatena orotica]|nr:ribonuclease D [Faecalicatena orotica]SCH91426.1 Ribonuclease D [uncultured Clostridium sp.]